MLILKSSISTCRRLRIRASAMTTFIAKQAWGVRLLVVFEVKMQQSNFWTIEIKDWITPQVNFFQQAQNRSLKSMGKDIGDGARQIVWKNCMW